MKKLSLIFIFALGCFIGFSQNQSSDLSRAELLGKKKAVVSLVGGVSGCRAPLGAGFVAGREGVVVTSYSSVIEAEDLIVKLKDGSTYTVDGVIYYDVDRDLILLEVDAFELSGLELAKPSLRVADIVYYLGQGPKDEDELGLGVISGILEKKDIKTFQITAPLTQKNLGGPLINSKGKVVGLVTSVAGSHQNFNLAVALDQIKPYLEKSSVERFSEFRKRKAQSDSYFKEAREAFENKQYRKAIDLIKRFVVLEPGNINAYNLLGYSFYKIKNYRQAITNYKKALALDENFIPAHNNLVLVYLEQGKKDKAIESYKNILQIEPEFLYVWHDLGRLNIQLENYYKAIAYYKRILEIDPNDFSAYNDLGWVYGAIGKYQEAIDCFKKYIEHKPQDPEIYFKLGLVYFEMNKISKAKENFSQAKNLASKQGRALLLQSLDKALSAIGE